ncbi:hypothetical protein [Pontiella sp.]|uniref:hypothetical protein n=1 Tax=Pontiella sp. TaxID=2837462 RepID=UPI003563F543
MKTRWFVVGIVGLALAAAAAPGKRYAARISVQGDLEKDRDSSKTESAKSNSSSKTETQYYDLKVTVANTGKYDGTFDLEWYFFKRPLDAKGKKGDPVLCEKDKTSLTLGGMQRTEHLITSGSLSWTESKSSKSSSGKNSNSSAKKSISGAVYGGYVLLLRADGEIVAKNASDRKFLSDEWIAMLQAPVKKTVASNTAKKRKPRKKKK